MIAVANLDVSILEHESVRAGGGAAALFYHRLFKAMAEDHMIDRCKGFPRCLSGTQYELFEATDLRSDVLDSCRGLAWPG
jgi:uncharacterized protein (DUF779 family)